MKLYISVAFLLFCAVIPAFGNKDETIPDESSIVKARLETCGG